MTSELIVFLVLSLVAIASALGMLFSRNTIYSALFLVLNFVTVAVFYLMLGAPFIAMSQITVYAGAIMVLFLFVIMLLGAESVTSPTQGMSWQRPLAFLLAITLTVESVYLIFARARLDMGIHHPAGRRDLPRPRPPSPERFRHDLPDEPRPSARLRTIQMV